MLCSSVYPSISNSLLLTLYLSNTVFFHYGIADGHNMGEICDKLTQETISAGAYYKNDITLVKEHTDINVGRSL